LTKINLLRVDMTVSGKRGYKKRRGGEKIAWPMQKKNTTLKPK